MGLENQGAKPTGPIGKIFGRLMNRMHTKLYANYFSHHLPDKNATILDIGCGGGKFIQFLQQQNKGYCTYGLDHSAEMIALSKRLNLKTTQNKKSLFFEGSVLKIPLENESIDVATAFETIQFWPNITDALQEVHRVLKPDGKMVIINRYPKENTKWWNMANIKNDKEYHKRLLSAGFKNIRTNLNYKPGWIVVHASK